MRQKMQKLNIGRIIAVLLAFVFLISGIPTANAADIGGDCGEGVKWSLENGCLIISGKGAMQNYGEFSPAPWAEYEDSILSVRVEEGVTNVGDFAFFQLENAEAASIAGTVEKIGGWAFYGCSGLEVLTLGSGIKEIGESAFELCESLPHVRLPATLETIRAEAFYRCESLLGVTIPASVTLMEPSVFTYCSSLKSAAVHANIAELPYWTFYGCYELVSVSLSASIADTGVQAFEDCHVLTTVNLGGTGVAAETIKGKLPHTVTDFNSGADISAGGVSSSSSSSTDENGNNVTVDSSYRETENSSVSTEVTHTKGNGTNTAGVKVDATVENSDGWSELREEMVNAMQQREYAADKETMEINVRLNGEPNVSASDLAVFEGKDANVSIYTSQGAVWEINGKDIYEKDLSAEYDLSFTLALIDEPSKKQADVIGSSGYLLIFGSDIDFKVEVRLPLGAALARNTAVFFSPEKSGGYTRMQASVIDGEGIAHFYLASVKAKAEYLIGINVASLEAPHDGLSDAIVPDELAGEYPELDYTEPIQYVITDVKSSWGLDFSQVSLILAAVMIGCILVVGVVVFVIFKSKRRNYYDPVLDGKKK